MNEANTTPESNTLTVEEAVEAIKVAPNIKPNSSLWSKVKKFTTFSAVVLALSVGAHYVAPYVPRAIQSTASVTNPSDLVRVREVRKHYLQAIQGDGQIVLRTGGNLSWRLNNPGKIVHDDFTRANGALGSDGKYAIFPSVESGMKAAEKLLFETAPYKDMTIKDAIAKWAPKKDGYKPDVYAKTVTTAASAKLTDNMSSLTANQRAQFLAAMRGLERWTEGKVRIFASEEDFQKHGW